MIRVLQDLAVNTLVDEMQILTLVREDNLLTKVQILIPTNLSTRDMSLLPRTLHMA
jgi:hypothetical protein